MAKLTGLGALERAVMDHLWATEGPQTVRQVHDALCVQRDLAYTTVMTVLQRLARKSLVVQIRDDRAHSVDRRAALMNFVERVGAEEADALRSALADLEAKHHRAGGCPAP